MKRFLIWVPVMLFFTTSLFAQADLRKKEFNISKTSIAISGHDPVAYFTQNKAVEGNKSNIAVHEGITYYFATPQNRDLFKANPAKYEPQYGGWCAYAMGASGDKVSIDPETFKIADDKLYLFYNKFFVNTLKSWNKNEADLKRKANANWLKIHPKQ